MSEGNGIYVEHVEHVPSELFGTELGITLDRYRLILNGLDQKQRMQRIDPLEMFNRVINSIQMDMEKEEV